MYQQIDNTKWKVQSCIRWNYNYIYVQHAHHLHGDIQARWASRHPADGHLLKKTVLFFIIMLAYKLFIRAGPIAHLGYPLFKSWLKACFPVLSTITDF